MSSIEDGLDNVGRQQGQAEDAADIGGVDLLGGGDFLDGGVDAGFQQLAPAKRPDQRQEEVTKPIETASIDDNAFAQLARQTNYSKIDALRRICDMARKNGALGADNALNAVSDKKGGK